MKSTIQTMVTFCCVAFCLTVLPRAFAQNQAPFSSAGQISGTLKNAWYPEALYPDGLIPDWDRGYVIHYEFESNYSPETPMVVMYDANGDRVREGRIWPQGAARVSVRRTAATKDGGILAAGGATLKDGSKQHYLARTDLAGNTVQTMWTGGFYPEQICEAPDGTVWTLGDPRDADGKQQHDADILRQYSFEKGLLHSFLPERTAEALVRSKTPWFNPFGSYVRCGKNKVSVYLEFTKEYVEVDTATLALNRWKLDLDLTQYREGDGMAVTEDGRVYLGLQVVQGRPLFRGLYQIKAVPGHPMAELMPVSGAVSPLKPGEVPPAGSFVMLWGADGKQLVVWRAEDNGSTMSWVNVVQSDSTD